MPMPFEFVIDGPPVSQQARRRRRVREWTREVKDAAESRWDTGSPFAGEVVVIITYFYKGGSLDVDNIPKPILDALKGLVYSDDAEISDLLCRKRDLNGDLQIRNPSSLLLDALRDTEQQLLHITVDSALNQEVAW